MEKIYSYRLSIFDSGFKNVSRKEAMDVFKKLRNQLGSPVVDKNFPNFTIYQFFHDGFDCATVMIGIK